MVSPMLGSVDLMQDGQCDWLNDYQFHPYRHVPNSNGWRSWWSSQLKYWASTGRLVQQDWNGQVCGIGHWSPLPWDSEMLGISAGRVDVLAVGGGGTAERRQSYRRMLGSIESQCRAAGVVHLTARADAADLASAHALQEAGFEMMDGILTFCRKIPSDGQQREHRAQVSLFEDWQLDGVLSLAGSVYRLDRFHSDPELDRSRSDQLHREWMRNSCLGSAADAVIVAHANREVLGFASVKQDRELAQRTGIRLATIVLVATAGAARGMGIGKSVTNSCLEWMAANGVGIAQVGTQLANINASRLYESCGFQLAGSSLTMRKMLR